MGPRHGSVGSGPEKPPRARRQRERGIVVGGNGKSYEYGQFNGAVGMSATILLAAGPIAGGLPAAVAPALQYARKKGGIDAICPP